MPDNPIILDIQGEDGFTLDMQDSDGLDFEAQPFSKGDPGKSAYQVAVDNGFSGTEEEWLASLVGPEGPPGTTDWDGITNKPYIPFEQGFDENGQPVAGAIKAKDYVTSGGVTRTNSAPYVGAFVAGGGNTATGNYAAVAGVGNTAYVYSISAGRDNSASGVASFAVGYGSNATAQCAVAIGQNNTASGVASFAEAYHTQATERGAHAEGFSTIASNLASHAEGHTTTASRSVSHAEGWETVASGSMSHAEGHGTQATARYNHVFGEYNISDPGFVAANARGTYIEIVGNGDDAQNRSNARTLDWDGNEVLSGKLTVGAGPTANMDVATKQYVDNAVLNAAVNANECLTFWHASDVI